MNSYLLQKFTGQARLVRLVMACLLLAHGSMPGKAESAHEITLKMLSQRARQQTATASALKSFHGFQFTDRVVQSQIRFQHRIVDDAGRDYKAAHYDHGNGLAVADVDGDDLLDLYFTNQLGTNQLWRNIGGGQFENITTRAGVGMANQISVGASFADVDNDGDPDLYVTTVRHGNRLFENLGKGVFRDITVQAGVQYSGHSSSAVFFDFDRDGWLDLLLVNVGKYTTDQRGRGGYFLSHTNAFAGHLFPERSETTLLYRNHGDAQRKTLPGQPAAWAGFTNINAAVGFEDLGWSGDATFTDLNEDGFPDVYLANMQGDDHYYENHAGKKLVDRTVDLFPKTPWGAIQPRFLDYNLDGLMDLFVTDMHSDMTQPQTEKALNFDLAMEKAKSEAFCAIQWSDGYLQGSSNNLFGNAFYLNSGNGRFAEVSTTLGVETYWPWGSSAGDLNADGYEDLLITAGMGYPFRYAINSVLLNEGGQRFVDSEFILGVEPRGDRRTEKVWFVLDCDGADRSRPECSGKSGELPVMGTLSSRSSAIFDLDNDGDLDIVTSELNYRSQVLVSNLSEKRPLHFLKIKLHGTQSNRDALGATVVVRADGKNYTRYHDGKSGYLAQSSIPLYFGLGDSSQIESIGIKWPSGKRETRTKDIGINQTLTFTEP
jgi:hypothetical protein